MEKLDQNLQRRVWQRVYDQSSQLTKQQRAQLQQSLQRATANRAVFESLENHPLYAEAFARMAKETAEQVKMLRRILGK